MNKRLRPILHVNIKDATGKVLADVDAPSTADAMAYFLTSRHIDEAATEDRIKNESEVRSDTKRIVSVHRDWDGRVLAEYEAVVH